ncbi:hypothetical protein ACFYYP_02785 [Microbispora rosea]|uniref:hypothetical protein n=1 Tax=Microbispora rosea TaxID=58117 RepID=UPI0036B672A8
MDVHLINHEGIEERPVEELPTLLGRQDGLVWVDMHAPERGKRGHVHYIELDQLIGRNYLVTGVAPHRC